MTRVTRVEAEPRAGTVLVDDVAVS
jgi:hypothetical protein